MIDDSIWLQKLRERLEFSPAPVALIGSQSEIIFASQSFAALVGEPIGGGKKFDDFLDEQAREELRKFLRDADEKLMLTAGRNILVSGAIKSADKEIRARFSFLAMRPGSGLEGYLVTVHLDGGQELQDHLTKLPNRREAEDRLRLEWERLKRSKGAFSVGLGDIDHFKSINDRFGHDVGDAVLVHVARALESSLRAGDWCARWGGEEFLLFVSGAKGDEGLPALERARIALEKSPYPAAIGDIKITMSFGVVASDGDYVRYQQMISEADILLYESKRHGRNRITARDGAPGPVFWPREEIAAVLSEGRLGVGYCPVDNWDGEIIALCAVPILDAESIQSGALMAERMFRSAEVLGMLGEVESAFFERVAADAPSCGGRKIFLTLSAQTLVQPSRVAAIAARLRELPPQSLALGMSGKTSDAESPAALQSLFFAGAPLILDEVEIQAVPLFLLSRFNFAFLILEEWSPMHGDDEIRLDELLKGVVANIHRSNTKVIVGKMPDDLSRREKIRKLGVDGCRRSVPPRPLKEILEGDLR